MRRDDSVFFFTLVDFLLTALFFGVVLFAVGRKESRSQAGVSKKAAVIDTLTKLTGISDLTTLTDSLTRLGPLRTAVSAVQLVRQAGGLEKAKTALNAVAGNGGSDSVVVRLKRLSDREGAGKPHCLYAANGKDAAAIATVVATDSTLSFKATTKDLTAVLASLGVGFADVRILHFREFRNTFERLVDLHPACRYTIDFVERTRYIDARDAARGIFYMRIHHEPAG